MFPVVAFRRPFGLFVGRLLGWVSWKWMRRFFVLMSMAVNLGMLCYFKYTNLLLGTIADFTREPFEPLDIVLPIGISFFTFRFCHPPPIYHGTLSFSKS